MSAPHYVSPAELVDWTLDAVRYSPVTPPGLGPWIQGENDGQRLAICPTCQRRMSARGLRPHHEGAPWTHGADAGRQCIGGCGAYSPSPQREGGKP